MSEPTGPQRHEPHALPVPAYCETCGAIWGFPSFLTAGRGSAGATITINNVTVPCPNGHRGRLVDGAYSVAETLSGFVTLLSPSITQQLAELMREPKTVESPEAFAASLSDLAKAVAGLSGQDQVQTEALHGIERQFGMLNHKDWSFYVLLLMAILGGLGGAAAVVSVIQR